MRNPFPHETRFRRSEDSARSSARGPVRSAFGLIFRTDLAPIGSNFPHAEIRAECLTCGFRTCGMRFPHRPPSVRLQPPPLGGGAGHRTPQQTFSTDTLPSMTEQRPSKVVHPRLDPTVYDRLVRWAEQDRRSISQAVSILLERALDAEDAK